MADFFQSRTLTTLSSISFNEKNPPLQPYMDATIVVMIPCHTRHLKQPLVFDLLKKLKLILYVNEFVIIVNGPEPDYAAVQELRKLDHRATVLIENDTHRQQLSLLLERDADALPGKGWALWLGFAYAIQRHENAFIATLDADIKNFNEAFLLKLLYPMVYLKADFNKGYYVRHSHHKLDGRLTRLLIFPLFKAMHLHMQPTPWLDFLSEFRYPLSGDVAITSQLIKQISLQPGWSYDLSLLLEVFKILPQGQLFQTEITDNYQHLHRDANNDTTDGLGRVAIELIHFLLNLHAFNVERLSADYVQIAHHYIAKYEALALFNSFSFHRTEEEQLVTKLADFMVSNATTTCPLPAWNRIGHQPKFVEFIADLKNCE